MAETNATARAKSSFEPFGSTNMVVQHELNTGGVMIDIRRVWWAEPIRGRVAYNQDCIEYVLRAGAPARVFDDGGNAGSAVGAVMAVPRGWHFDAACAPGEVVKMCLALDSAAGALARAVPAAPVARYDIRAPRVAAVLARIAEEVRLPGLSHDVLIELLVGQLLVEIGRSEADTPVSDNSPPKGARVNAVLERIERDLDGGIDVAQLAHEFGMTPRTLLRVFRKEMGASVSGYVSTARARRAKRELAAGTPIKTVAHRCGFGSTSAFAAAFRRMTGSTPGDYRRNG